MVYSTVYNSLQAWPRNMNFRCFLWLLGPFRPLGALAPWSPWPSWNQPRASSTIRPAVSCSKPIRNPCYTTRLWLSTLDWTAVERKNKQAFWKNVCASMNSLWCMFEVLCFTCRLVESIIPTHTPAHFTFLFFPRPQNRTTPAEINVPFDPLSPLAPFGLGPLDP